MATVQWTHSVRLRKHLANRHGAMLHSVLARQGRINARALARRAGRPNPVIIIVADLGSGTASLSTLPLPTRKARRHAVAIDDGHLKAICLAVQQGEVHGRVAAHARRCSDVLCSCHDGDARRAVCVGRIRRGGTAGTLLWLLVFGLHKAVPCRLHRVVGGGKLFLARVGVCKRPPLRRAGLLAGLPRSGRCIRPGRSALSRR